MNTILVFNVGSSSVKYAVFQNEECVVQENFERIKTPNERNKVLQKISQTVTEKQLTPTHIGHRIVHGGTISHTTKIDPVIRKQLDIVSQLAPLHNIPELEVVDACETLFGVPQFAIFDTAFHQSIPQKNHRYAIPKEYYDQGVRKYGFHGISHEFVSQGFSGNVITCHLGSGGSITAIKDGKSIQTSMGFTPLDGLIMGTRPGRLGPGVVLELLKKNDLNITKVEEILNHKSGLMAIAGSNDMRDLLASSSDDAKLAVEMYVQRIIETIGSYIATLTGVDTIVFTAGTGERSAIIRQKICDSFKYVGLELNTQVNEATSAVRATISSDNSKVTVVVVPTNEELAIAQKVEKLI